jgi:hypothetical protein
MFETIILLVGRNIEREGVLEQGAGRILGPKRDEVMGG